MLIQAGVTNVGLFYFVADGQGVLSSFSSFNLLTPPGHYAVGSSGSVNLTVEGNQTNTVTGQFVTPRRSCLPGPPQTCLGE